ncbi:MAG: Mov34/MPN/PAD-1 family protein [Candidatus Norongarragalinales archaeon]
MKTTDEKILLVITKRALESALESSRAVFPSEFIGLFRGRETRTNRGTSVKLDELIIAPLSEYGEGFSSYSDVFLPLHLQAIATFHSHTAPPAVPSKGDLHFFSRKGKFHFIACPPFDWRVLAADYAPCVRAFNSRGSELEFRVV